MPSHTSRIGPFGAAYGRRGITAAALLGLSSPALGGLVHDWDGSAGTDWHTTFNWNTNLVPGAGDSVIILNGAQLGVLLSDDTALIDSLYIAGQMWLSNNGHRIRVSGPTASTRVVQDNSMIVVGSAGGQKGLDTDTLSLENGGELWMQGGLVEVDEEFRILGSGGLITGWGRMDVRGPQAAAFGGVNGNLVVDGGELRINMVNDGTMSLPAEMTITGAGDRLRLDGPFHSDINDVSIGNGGRLSVSENWTLGGTLSATAAGARTVDGAGRAELDGTVSTTSGATLHFDCETDFNAGGVLSTWLATVELHNTFFSQAGHQTNIGWASRVVFDQDSDTFFGWYGDIDMSGGFLEINTFAPLNGDLWMDTGVLANPPRLVGSSTAWLEGNVYVVADVAYFDADWEARPGSFVFVDVGAELFLSQTGVIRSGATMQGPGTVHIGPTGVLSADIDEEIGSNVVSDGRLEPGQPTGRFDIDANYVQSPAGTLEIEFSGPGALQRDRVEVLGGATLGGTLEVNLLGGYTPPLGTTFTILTASAVIGEFDTVIGPPGMDVTYFADHVRVTFNEPDCPWDFDGNGAVGFGDLSGLLALWGPCLGCPEDVDGNGEVGFGDLTDLLAHWGTCP